MQNLLTHPQVESNKKHFLRLSLIVVFFIDPIVYFRYFFWCKEDLLGLMFLLFLLSCFVWFADSAPVQFPILSPTREWNVDFGIVRNDLTLIVGGFSM